MTDQDILGTLTKIFRELFDDNSLVLTVDTNAEQILGWDSLKMISIVVAVEERFGVSFHSREVDKLENIRDLITLIHKKLP